MRYFKSLLQRLIASYLNLYDPQAAILMLHSVDNKYSHYSTCRSSLVFDADTLFESIDLLKKNGYCFISIGELNEALKQKKRLKKCLLLTLDDGFTDNFTKARLIFEYYSVPFIIYCVSGFVNRTEISFETVLDYGLSNNENFKYKDFYHNISDVKEKRILYNRINKSYVAGTADEKRKILDAIIRLNDIDLSIIESLYMDAMQLKSLSEAKGATIGAHTASHIMMSSQPDSTVLGELYECKRYLEFITQKKVQHFAYPYGSFLAVGKRERLMTEHAGFETAVSTVNATVSEFHYLHTFELPRINLDGDAYYKNPIKLLNTIHMLFGVGTN